MIFVIIFANISTIMFRNLISIVICYLKCSSSAIVCDVNKVTRNAYLVW